MPPMEPGSAATATTSERGLETLDDYRLVRRLGATDTVYLAHDVLLDRAVVLAFLPDAPDERAARLAAARAFARVSHPNLGRVHRVREGGPRPYVVAAFVRGRRLDAVATPLPDERVVELGKALAGALASLHQAGAVHGAVHAGRVLVSDEGEPQLLGFDRARAPADERAKREDVVALSNLLRALAGDELRSRLASLAEGDHGVATAEELRHALEALLRPKVPRELLADNPYRGLRAFEREHASVFFGREREVAMLLERLRVQPWLLVAGRSGTGKSSLARAGLGPRVAEGALGERARWDVAAFVPGTHPLHALARVLAPILGGDRDELVSSLRRDPALASHLARARAGRGLLLIVDQLEELITLSSPEDRAAFVRVIERLGALAPGLRTVFTLRADFLDRLVELGPFGQDLARATYLLPAMSDEGLRAAIVGPARAQGVELETAAMVDALVEEVRHHDEALPLLSFVLAELWGARDGERHVIPEAALRALGGVVAAFARHGDTVLATLREHERKEARRILLSLVTAAETRARPTAEELVTGGGPAASTALEALVRGRLVVSGETCELAHEALARAWPRLREWLDEASAARQAASWLRSAAQEWRRLGRGELGLASATLLRDLEVPGALDGASEDERAFVTASRAASRRARARRRALAVGVPAALTLVALGCWAALHARHRIAVGRALAAARELEARSAETARAADRARRDAFALFDADDVGPAELRWERALALEEQADRERRDVAVALDAALALEPTNAGARALYADVTLARFLAAERLHRGPLLDTLRATLAAYDDGSRRAQLEARGRVRVQVDPVGATLTLARYREEEGGKLVETDPIPFVADEPHELVPGSYLLVATAPGRSPTRYPFLLRRGEEPTLRITLPRAEDVPEGMIFVPGGRTLYGSSDDEATRRFYTHQPAHDVDVGPFLIARTEVTNAEYMVFLRALPPAERQARMPAGLRESADGTLVWILRERALAPGEPYCSEAQPCVDWKLLPVDGANREDGERYAAWLSRTGRLPGARLCTDREWERAARGADDRRYPGGNGAVGPNDACHVGAYGGAAARAGPCAAGTHPASRSPFGVDDLAGSVWEWTAGSADRERPEEGMLRGGSWRDSEGYLAVSNRGLQSPTRRYWGNALRVCADLRSGDR